MTIKKKISNSPNPELRQNKFIPDKKNNRSIALHQKNK